MTTKATELKVTMRSMLMDHFGPIIDRYIDEHWPDETYTGTPVDFVSNTAGQIDVGRIEDLLGFWSRQPESMFIEENGSIFVNEINMVEVNRHTGEMDVI